MNFSLFNYINRTFIDPLLYTVFNLIADYSAKNKLTPFLVVCSGSGHSCNALHRHGIVTYGIDIDSDVTRKAKTRFPGIFFICSDAAAIPAKTGTFKGIAIIYALHDKQPALRNAILTEAQRLLHPAGRIALFDIERPWSVLSFIGWCAKLTIECFSGHLHNTSHFFRSGGLVSLAQESALKIESETRFEFENSLLLFTVPDHNQQHHNPKRGNL